jgi:hypothetical protein
MAFTSHPLQPAHVSSKSASKDGHITLVAERVFRPYLDYHFIRAAATSHTVLPLRVLPGAQVWSKLVKNEGYFTLVAETIFRPYLH